MKRVSIFHLFFISITTIGSLVLNSCSESTLEGSFGYDLSFLQTHKDVVVLKTDGDQCQLAIIPDYQGRVMTSTAGGLSGKSYGWINFDLIASGEFEEHINVFGGEDRFWLGPEGGQYSIFFKNGTDYTVDNWYTPKPIDTEPFKLVESNATMASFKQEMHLTNRYGFEFDIDIEREVSIFNKFQIEENLGLDLGSDIQYVGYQSENRMKNIGESEWSRESGLLSIWILGMFSHSEKMTVIIPYKDSLELNTSYFGAIGPDRLAVADKAVYFKGDGKYRSKIGLPPSNVLPYFGSYDAENEILTIVEISFEGDSTYVNSLWEDQSNPYSGDVINSYNDGPFEDGSQLGPFYELESSSPAKELQPGQVVNHIHKTYHFEGDFDNLNSISLNVLGVDLNEINL